MGTENRTFEYKNRWTNRYSGYDRDIYVTSSGTSKLTSEAYPIQKVVSVYASVTGGWGWIATYPSWDEGSLHGASLKTDITVSIYLVKSDGSRKSVASATGSAGRGGTLNGYDHSTTNTCSYTITPSDIQTYSSVVVEYTVGSSASQVSMEKAYSGTFEDGATANPSGTSTITLKTTIPVTYNNGSELEAITYNNSVNVSALNYGGTPIY